MEVKLVEESKPFAEINIIPFVDIILVVLIIFMLAAPFAIQSGISLNLPQASTSKKLKTPQLHFIIQANGQVLINDTPVSSEQIEDYIQGNNTWVSQKKDIQVLISADRNVLHGKVISIINTLQLMGINKVAIASKNEQPVE